MKTPEQIAYDEFIAATAAALGTDEFWIIKHPDGKLLGPTASKDLGETVRTFCDALNVDWDDATEAGFELVRGIRQSANT